MSITKRSAREALGTNDAGLAAFFQITPGAVSQWPDDDPLPELRDAQLRLRRPDLFQSRRIDTPEAVASEFAIPPQGPATPASPAPESDPDGRRVEPYVESP